MTTAFIVLKKKGKKTRPSQCAQRFFDIDDVTLPHRKGSVNKLARHHAF